MFFESFFKCKILVVEDDPFFKAMLVPVIMDQESKAEIHWVGSVEDAQKKLQSNRYSLIISDYFLTGKENGIDLWRHCSASYPKIPFILMSGLSTEAIKKLLLKSLSGPRYLKKPFVFAECRKTIAEMLKR